MLPERCPQPRLMRPVSTLLLVAAVGVTAAVPGLHAQAAGQPSPSARPAPQGQRTAEEVARLAMLPTTLPLPAANPTDVESVDAILAALYDVISGDAGVARDWDRFRSLFVEHARLVPTGRRPDGSGAHRVMTPEGYIALNGAALERGGFHEREIGRRIERYGNIVHVFSAYDSKRRRDDAEPFARGINSIQLWNDGSRWHVISIFWQAETPDNPIPADILGKR